MSQCDQGMPSMDVLCAAFTPKYANPPSYSSPTSMTECPSSCLRKVSFQKYVVFEGCKPQYQWPVGERRCDHTRKNA